MWSARQWDLRARLPSLSAELLELLNKVKASQEQGKPGCVALSRTMSHLLLTSSVTASHKGWIWSHTAVVPALRLRQEDWKPEDSLTT